MKNLKLYLSIVIIFFFIFLESYKCNAQNPAQKVNAYYEFLGVLHDSAFGFPSRLGTASVYRIPGAAYYNVSDSNHLHVWTGHNDIAIGGGGGSQNLQQTVTIGDFKSIPIADSAVASDSGGYFSWHGYPSNYNTSYAPFGKMKDFVVGWQRFNGVNITIPRPNVVGIMWGYNTNPGGSIGDTSELAGFGFRTETSYNLNFGGRLVSELHLPEFYYNHGLGSERLWSYYIDNLNGSVIHQSQIQSMNWDTKDTNTPYYVFSANTQNNDSSTAWDEEIHLRDLAGPAPVASRSIDYVDGDWSKFSEVYDRGGVTWGLDASKPSNDNYTFQALGRTLGIDGTGYGATVNRISSFADQPTLGLVQMFSNSFGNNPSWQFDRRLGNGSPLIGDGSNGGDLVWGDDLSTRFSGIAHRTSSGGSIQLYDIQADLIDTTHTHTIPFKINSTGDVSTPLEGIIGPYLYFNPSTGNTINLIRGYNMIDPTPGAILSLTVGLPPSPVDGQVVEEKFSQAVTTLTYTGGTVKGSPTTIPQFQYIKLVYNLSGNFWF